MIRSIIVGGLAEAFEKVSEWVQTSIDQSLAEANLSDAIPLVGWALLFAQEAVEHSREDQKEQREERARKDRQREAERDAEDRRFRAALLAAPASEAELSASPGASTSE